MLEPSERLRNAVVEGNLSITKRILQKYPELWLNINSENGWNNLHYGSHNGNYLICYHLVSFINQFKDDNLELSNILSNHNDMLSFEGLSPLHLAIKSHHLQTLHYLLQEFPGIYWLNHKGGKNSQTPLHYSCIYGFPEGLKLLLEKGADYNICDEKRNNLLHLAFEYGNFDCIKVFLEFLYNLSSNTDVNLKIIRTFEKSKNINGWLPIELSIDFKLTNQYKSFKKRMAASNVSELSPDSSVNFSRHNSASASTSAPASAPVSVSASTSTVYINGTSGATNSDLDSGNVMERTIKVDFEDTESTPDSNSIPNSLGNSPGSNKVLSSPIVSMNEFKRAHSQSLPTQVEEELPSVSRQRANTTVTPHYFMPPSTPVIQKTPSLKSITISPSIRLNTDNDNIDLESTTSNSSPIKHSFPMMKSSPAPISTFIPSLNTPVSSQTVQVERQSIQQLRAANQTANQMGTYDEEAVVDSPSSIAAKIAFNSSRSSRSSMSSRTRSRTNSTTSESPVKGTPYGTLSSRPSQSHLSQPNTPYSPNGPPTPTPPHLQHSNSSNSTGSGTGPLSPSKHKNSISSISFSRVR